MDQERNQAPPEEFHLFLRKKRRFLLSAGIFFISFYFLFPLLVSWFPEGMNRPVWGPFSWAWLYAFAHFALVWILGVMYLRQANRWDRMAASLRRKDVSGEALPTEGEKHPPAEKRRDIAADSPEERKRFHLRAKRLRP